MVQVKDPTNIQSTYDELGNPVHATAAALNDAETLGAENSSAAEEVSGTTNGEQDAVQAAENDPATTGNWSVNRGVGAAKDGIDKGKKAVSILKKGGPFGAIIGLLIAGAGIVSFFGGPGLLIVNFAEVLTQKFNYQLGVMDARNTKIIEAKLNNTTKGPCLSITSALCKYSTFSDTEIKNFEKAGLKVNKTGTGVTGRTKISSFELLDGTAIDASKYSYAMKNVPEFKDAMKRAYNMKYLGTSDNIFMGLLERFKTGKAKPFADTDTTDAERAAELDNTVKNGSAQDVTTGVCKNPSKCTAEEIANNQKGAQTAESLVSDAADSADSTANNVLSEVSDVIDGAPNADVAGVTAKVTSAAGTAWKVGASALSITGVVDNACMVYGWVKAFSLAAKVVRSEQLIRFAMVFLTSASMIKAGTATSDTINYLGNLLTKTTTNADGTKTKAATDSIGYRYAAFGDTGLTASSLNAVIGATFPATIQKAIDFVTNTLGSRGKADSLCGFIANPFVQAGSLIIGIASFFIGAGEVKLSAQAVIAPALMIVAGFLPPMLGEILSGKVVTSSTAGEVAGDLATSGTGALLSKSATTGGGAVLKRSQAVLYMNYQKSVLADYADYDRSTHSPLDASNPNTFLGSIYTKIAPYVNQSASVTTALSSVGSILTSSVSNFLSPKASAVKDDFAQCKDAAVVDLDMATDIYCNPVAGIPTEYLDIDPITVYNDLVANGSIDAEGSVAPNSAYATFITNCVDRENPYGTSGADQVDHTADCFIDSRGKAEWYLYQADQRVLNVRENDTSGTASETVTPTGTCPTGTSIVPITEGWDNGKKTSITLCGIPSLVRIPVLADTEFVKPIYGGLASKDIKTHAVNAVAADALLKLISLAKSDKTTIVATFSYRSYNEQKAIRAIKTLDSSGNLTNTRLPGNYSADRAVAGTSNHEMGLSLDFSAGSRDWIKKCIANNLDGTDDNRCYGFYDDVGPSDDKHFTYKPA